MNLLSIDETSHYNLTQVIKIYRRKNPADDSLSSNYYLESQEAIKAGNKLTLSESKPFKQETLNDLSNYLHGRDQSSLRGFIPKRLIYQDPTIGNKTFIWYRESQKTFIQFAKKSKLPEDSQIHLPTLVFKARNRDLSVWALKTGKATPNSQLYQAPLLNVTGGRICMGTTRRIIDNEIDDINDINNLIKYWEDMLFGSEFNTGDGECRDSISHKKGLIYYLTELSKKQNRFDTEVLVPINKKVKDLINY